MKTLFVTVILFGSLSAAAFAKDRPSDPPPSWTLEQKLAFVIAQRDAAYQMIQASPGECGIVQGQNRVQGLAAEYNKGVDLAKWKQNPATLDFEPIPQKPEANTPAAPVPEAAKPETPKP